jgi:hypothetical protein
MRVSTALCRRQTRVRAVPISFVAPICGNRREKNMRKDKKMVLLWQIAELFRWLSNRA